MHVKGVGKSVSHFVYSVILSKFCSDSVAFFDY